MTVLLIFISKICLTIPDIIEWLTTAYYPVNGIHVTMYSLGAAMVGDTLFVPSVISRLTYNPLCMMRYENDRLPPDGWENVRTDLEFFSLYLLGRDRFLNLFFIHRSLSVSLVTWELYHQLSTSLTSISALLWVWDTPGSTPLERFDGTS